MADAITEVFSIFKRCNKYIDETMPWALAKDEEKKDRLATVLYNLVEGICINGFSGILYAGNNTAYSFPSFMQKEELWKT